MALYLSEQGKPFSTRLDKHHAEDKNVYDEPDISHVFILGKYRDLYE